MPKLQENQIPSYRLHKQSGQAIVTLSGRDIKLGKYDSDESWAKYRRLTAEWQTTRGVVTQPTPELAHVLTVAELLAAFLAHANTHYRKNGQRTSEYAVYVSIMRPLRQLYGDMPAAEFSPLKLSAVINEMIRMGRARKSINNNIHRIRNIFRWGVSNELVPASVVTALECVAALAKGRTAARETPKVKAVADERMAAVLPHVSRAGRVDDPNHAAHRDAPRRGLHHARLRPRHHHHRDEEPVGLQARKPQDRASRPGSCRHYRPARPSITRTDLAPQPPGIPLFAGRRRSRATCETA